MAEPDPFLRIRYLWHFTDRRNLDSIREHGLCPLATLRKKGIAIPAPGGNQLSHDLDATLGLDKYVHLSFVTRHPMEHSAKSDGRIVDASLLRVDRTVLEWDGVLFAPDIANKTGVTTCTLREAVGGIDFDGLYSWMDWKVPELQTRRQQAERCEILVPRTIPLELIKIYNG